MIRDIGYDETERILRNLERKLNKVYSRAVHESEEKLSAYLKEFEEQDAEKKLLVKSGSMTMKEYQAWRKDAMLTGDRYKNMLDTLAADYANTDKLAMKMVRDEIPRVYAENGNFATYELEHELSANLNFTLYNKDVVQKMMLEDKLVLPMPRVDIPKDKRWNRRHIKSEILQGILQGEGAENVARRLRNVANMNQSAAVRNARTAVTGAQNGARVDTYKRAKEKGIEVKQIWIATLDSRTRHSHALMDGEMIDVGGEFSNGLRYPGDPKGAPEEVYNCRCNMRGRLMGFSFSGDAIERDSRLSGMSYEDWRQFHADELKKQKNGGKTNGGNGS